MPTDTTEAALGACIERFLKGDVNMPTSNDCKVQGVPATLQAGKGVVCPHGVNRHHSYHGVLNP